MTGTVIWHMTMSLDGFIGDRDDRVDWMVSASTTAPAYTPPD